MNHQEVIRLYTEHERKDVNISGYTKICTEHTVRLIAPDEHGSFIAFFDFKGRDPLPIIREEVACFEKLGKNFEWKTYSTDAPDNIGELLIQQGFEPDEPESFMALDLTGFKSTPSDWTCTRITTPEGVADVVSVSEAVWNKDCSHQKQHLINQLETAPELISIYCVYADGKPVSSARIEFSENSPFAGIWGGATLQDYRKKGIYQTLLNIRAQEAIERGYQYLIIDASEMSRPIVERHGFQFISKTTPYEYKVSK